MHLTLQASKSEAAVDAVLLAVTHGTARLEPTTTYAFTAYLTAHGTESCTEVPGLWDVTSTLRWQMPMLKQYLPAHFYISPWILCSSRS